MRDPILRDLPSKYTEVVSCRVQKEFAGLFDRIYPGCKNVFIRRALHLALNSKEFFESVMFNSFFADHREGVVKYDIFEQRKNEESFVSINPDESLKEFI